MKKTPCLLVLLILFLNACTQNQEVTIITPLKVKSVLDFSGNTFFSEIVDIEISDDYLFFADKGSKKILVTDHNFNLVRKLGKTGDGPLEIRKASNFDFHKDTLYLNAGGGRMIRYAIDGTPVSSFNYKLLGNYEFHINDHALFSFDYSAQDQPLASFDKSDGRLLSNFGDIPSPKGSTTRQHLLGNDKLLIAIYAVNQPLIKIYSPEGQLLSSTDLSNLDIIKSLEKNRETPSIQSSVNVQVFNSLFRDAWLIDDTLYLLSLSADEPETVECSTVLKFKIDSDHKVTLQDIIKLDKSGWYTSIALYNGGKELLAFENKNGTIDLYNLEK